jgi:hypothetical protein
VEAVIQGCDAGPLGGGAGRDGCAEAADYCHAVQKVETTIAAALPEVWKAFSAEAQQQHGAEGRRSELDTQLRDMLARLANAGKAL